MPLCLWKESLLPMLNHFTWLLQEANTLPMVSIGVLKGRIKSLGSRASATWPEFKLLLSSTSCMISGKLHNLSKGSFYLSDSCDK